MDNEKTDPLLFLQKFENVFLYFIERNFDLTMFNDITKNLKYLSLYCDKIINLDNLLALENQKIHIKKLEVLELYNHAVNILPKLLFLTENMPNLLAIYCNEKHVAEIKEKKIDFFIPVIFKIFMSFESLALIEVIKTNKKFVLEISISCLNDLFLNRNLFEKLKPFVEKNIKRIVFNVTRGKKKQQLKKDTISFLSGYWNIPINSKKTSKNYSINI